MRKASCQRVAELRKRVLALGDTTGDTTMEQVAVSIGLDPSSLSRQLNRIRPMPHHVANKLATKLDLLEAYELPRPHSPVPRDRICGVASQLPDWLSRRSFACMKRMKSAILLIASSDSSLPVDLSANDASFMTNSRSASMGDCSALDSGSGCL